jgi:hypothetical protein
VPRLPRFLNTLLGPKRVVRELEIDGHDLTRSADGPSGNAFDPLPSPFVLLLRTFGADGVVRVGNPKDGPGYDKNTLESVIVRTASEFGARTLAFHDEGAEFVQKGLDVRVAPNARWRERFSPVARAADAIVVLTTVEAELGPSFRDELDEISRLGPDCRVIVVCAPGLDETPRSIASDVFEHLRWPAPPGKLLVASRARGGSLHVVPSLGAHDDSLADRYRRGLRHGYSMAMGPGAT